MTQDELSRGLEESRSALACLSTIKDCLLEKSITGHSAHEHARAIDFVDSLASQVAAAIQDYMKQAKTADREPEQATNKTEEPAK